MAALAGEKMSVKLPLSRESKFWMKSCSFAIEECLSQAYKLNQASEEPNDIPVYCGSVNTV